MNIVHFADAHIGVTTHGKNDPIIGLNDRVLDFLDALDFIVDFVERNPIDLVLFAGDMFHHNKPGPALIAAVSTRIRELASFCPIVLIPGNHDQAANRVSALQFLEELEIENVYVSDFPKSYTFDDLGIFIGAMPYPTYGMFDVNSRGDEASIELKAKVALQLDEWLEEAEDYDTAILLMHGTFEGVKWGEYTSRALGSESTFFKEDMQNWDYVALGHIHLYQDVTHGTEKWMPPVVYAGSIERVDFGESGENRYFVHIKVTEAGLSYRPIKIPARPMVTIDIDLSTTPYVKQAQKLILKAKRQSLPADALVRLRIEAGTNQIDDEAISRLEKMVHRLAVININKDRPPEREKKIENIQELTVDELLEEWLILQDLPDDTIDDVLDIFDTILEEIE